MQKITNGVYKFVLGEPEALTPFSVLKPEIRFEELNSLPDIPCPFCDGDFVTRARRGAFNIEIPLAPGEDLYGMGLQLKSFKQTGLKKTLKTNSDPAADTGDSHAPVPFYVSTAGYGVFVDTARYVTFYLGNCKMRGSKQDKDGFESAGTEFGHWWIKGGSGNVFVDIPAASGAEVYVFSGRGLRDVVARYNLFSGGGAFVPMWGLGVLYRAYMPGDQKHILKLAHHLRDEGIPCDIFGLEPGWQTHAYSCTYVWDKERFPDPDGMLSELNGMGFHVNLWEHPYVNPKSPLFSEIGDAAGSCYVWDGLVPDFTIKKAQDSFVSHHKKLKQQGISGFKLDESDNSDYLANWGFPDFTQFPSGLDGEQMHTLFGSLYQRTINRVYSEDGMRTYGQTRQSTAFAAPEPYAMYSDLYDHVDFVRGMASAAFAGLLWTPEVRQADSRDDLLRRIAATVVSPQTLLNCFQVPSPPWKQYDYYKNLNGEYLPDSEDLTEKCRTLLNIRMMLVPHLYTAFYRYYKQGIPPVRPLVMDYDGDLRCRDLWDEYLLGEGLLAAPVIAGSGGGRSVYLPEGVWYDFYTGVCFTGGQTVERDVPLDKIPLFVCSGTLLALAEPVTHIADDTVFSIHLHAYGTGGESCELVCDDGVTDAYRKDGVELMHIRADRDGYIVDGDFRRYKIIDFTRHE